MVATKKNLNKQKNPPKTDLRIEDFEFKDDSNLEFSKESRSIEKLFEKEIAKSIEVEKSIEREKSLEIITTEAAKEANRQGENKGVSMVGCLRKKFAVTVALQNMRTSVICSPLSALMPLGKLAIGASGASLKELQKLIGVTENSKLKSKFKELIDTLKHISGVTLNIASQIYIRNDVDLKPSYEAKAKEIFTVSIEKMDFNKPENAAKKINSWIESETQGKIRNTVKPDQIKSASIVIVNAIYFMGSWKYPFQSVQVLPFHAQSGTQNIPMMIRDGTYRYGKSETLDCTLLEIPYKEDQASFVVVLPNSRDGLSVLLHALKVAPDLLDKSVKQMKEQRVKVTLPKFKIETELDLKEIYKTIGVKKIFNVPSGLTEIMQDGETKVGTAIQKSMIEVTETGTTAAAASGDDAATPPIPASLAERSRLAAEDWESANDTATLLFPCGTTSIAEVVTVLGATQFGNPVVTFNANHPFFFLVLTERQQLFTGTLVEP